jgi:hypothetical protein
MSDPFDNEAQVRHVLETSSTFIEASVKLGFSPWYGYCFLRDFQKKHNIKMLPIPADYNHQGWLAHV